MIRKRYQEKPPPFSLNEPFSRISMTLFSHFYIAISIFRVPFFVYNEFDRGKNMKKIIFVSHCILNNASKVVLYNQKEIEAEEDLRVRFLNKVLNSGVQIIQLPCPEFTLYGSRRWGHVSDQFDNPFFRRHCRNILTPIVEQLKEYLNNDSFRVLGIVGIDG